MTLEEQRRIVHETIKRIQEEFNKAVEPYIRQLAFIESIEQRPILVDPQIAEQAGLIPMTPEGKVKEGVKQFLHNKGCVRAGISTFNWPDIVYGWFYMPVQNGMGVTGIPDFIVCYKGLFVGIETKAPGKVEALTENQKARINEIEMAWGKAFVIDDVEDLNKQWKEWEVSLG